MIWRCLDSWAILAAFAAAYVIPPLPALRHFRPAADWPTQLVVSAGLGLSSQALLGFFWNHFAANRPTWEACVYFTLWISAGMAMWRRKSKSVRPQPTSIDHLPLALPLIILAAVALRSLDALTHASLGQSDAYTHLQFLRDVVRCGQIRNVVYPPGYAWVLALPTMAFALDPYLVARYVGPFFGALMVATLFLLGQRHTLLNGLLTGFLAAVCPLFYPLIKTGMGAFANQMGLFLLPLALLSYMNRSPYLFAILLLGLTVSVPLFVFPLLLMIAVHRLLCLPRSAERRSLSQSPWGGGGAARPLAHRPLNTRTASLCCMLRPWWAETLPILFPVILSILLAGYQFLSPGNLHIAATATLVTGIQSPAARQLSTAARPPGVLTRIKSHPAGKLLVDLLTVKRWGLGNRLMNVAVLVLAVVFTGILLAGIGSRDPRHPRQGHSPGLQVGHGLGNPTSWTCGTGDSRDFLTILGGWGLLATIQTATGFLEFSLYQRSGWFLMETVALAAGVILSWLHDVEGMRKVIRPAMVLGLSATLALAFRTPPQHHCITSGAENELATVLRELSAARLDALHVQRPLMFERRMPSALIAQAATAPQLTIVTRRYTLFPGDQGNMTDVLPDPAARIRHLPVEQDTTLNPPSDHFLCLVDRFSALPDMELLSRISPELTRSLSEHQALLYKPNDVILAFLTALPTNVWRITEESRGLNLSVFLVERLRP